MKPCSPVSSSAFSSSSASNSLLAANYLFVDIHHIDITSSGADIFLRRRYLTFLIETYEPTSRRPIANAFRATAHLAVRFCVRFRIHPDAISYASIVAAAGAGLCFWRSQSHSALLIVGPLLCYIRLWLNMLDGMVALAEGKASKRGEILNDLPDRISDVLIFAGVAHSGLCHVPSGYWAAILALLTAYVGTLGQAVGVQREFSGIMSKPWRMVVLHIGSWLTWLQLWRGISLQIGPFTLLDWSCVVVVLGCIQTIAVRLKRIFSALPKL